MTPRAGLRRLLSIPGLALGVTLGAAAADAQVTACPGLQDGSAKRTLFNNPAAYSNCTFHFTGDQDYYFAIENNAGTINIFGALNTTDFNPAAGTKVITGATGTATEYGGIDAGTSFPGDCRNVSGADPGGGITLTTGHWYCVIYDSASANDIFIRTKWDGAQFTQTTIAYGIKLPIFADGFESHDTTAWSAAVP